MKKENLPKVGQRIRYKVGESRTKVAIVTDIYPDSIFPIEVDRKGVRGLIRLDEIIGEGSNLKKKKEVN